MSTAPRPGFQQAPLPFITPNFSAIPEELKQFPGWTYWKLEEQGGRLTKVPYMSSNKKADPTKPETWVSFDKIRDNFDPTIYSGVNCAVRAPFVGIDLDHCRHPETGTIEPWALEIINGYGAYTYTEITPSGTGFRLWAKLPQRWGSRDYVVLPNGNRSGNVEIYQRDKFLSVTGNHCRGTPLTIEERPNLTKFHEVYILNGRGAQVLQGWQPYTEESKSKPKGDTSKSGEEFRIACQIARELGPSATLDEVLQEFLKRAEHRSKWDTNRSYIERTIKNAIGTVHGGATTTAQFESTLQVVMADAVDPTKTKWAWPKRVPFGHLTIFCGPPDNGKSITTNFVASVMTTGASFPDAENTTEPCEVAILAGEDGIQDTVVPRLMAAGADRSKVHLIQSVTYHNKTKEESRYLQLDTDVKMLWDYLTAHPKIKLIIIDPISNYLGNTKMTDEQSVRRVLNPVKDMAEATGCAIIGVMHLNKKEDLSAINRIAGAMAFVGIARATWMFVANPKDSDSPIPDELQPDTFSMLRVKVNIAERSGGLTYRIKAKPIRVEDCDEWYPYIEWTGTTNKNADNVLKQKHERGRPSEERNEAMSWLMDFLKDGPQPVTHIEEQGKGLHGFSKRTLERAKKEVRAVARKQGNEWYWMLEKHADDLIM